jgi:hypothetical protein
MFIKISCPEKKSSITFEYRAIRGKRKEILASLQRGKSNLCAMWRYNPSLLSHSDLKASMGFNLDAFLAG